ncbi:MAG: class II fructose-bisphosphate aldolase [Chloroflexi bacterium]|nr:class II fructose-bisphosphate aldolase [Chloroflexota bacterium]
MEQLLHLIENSLQVDGEEISVVNEAVFRANIAKLAKVSALGEREEAAQARYLIRAAALNLGIIPASIQDLYLARGRGELPATWTTPAFNFRAMSFDCARAAFRSARKVDATAMIFELARVEIDWTDQPPAEYAASILAAAIAEGYRGPLFLQGDHFQVSASLPLQQEKASVEDLITEAVSAGFFNIDLDTSTLVDLSQLTVPQQQTVNATVSAELAAHVRKVQPVTISIGGEIGEVGGHVSTVEELTSYMKQFNEKFSALVPNQPGLSKVSIHTGTAHGGIVLPDGSMAKVNIDFDALKNLGQVARDEYGMGGAVQHGASTLPPELFNHFVEYSAIEVHLATAFMTTFYRNIPVELKNEMFAWLDEHHAADRTSDMTDEQFHHTTQMHALAPFKAAAWNLPTDAKDQLGAAWEAQFDMLFDRLGCANTRQIVEQVIHPVRVKPHLEDYLASRNAPGQVKGLAG